MNLFYLLLIIGAVVLFGGIIGKVFGLALKIAGVIIVLGILIGLSSLFFLGSL